jgi:hypothetical protein
LLLVGELYLRGKERAGKKEQIATGFVQEMIL